jgi:hypothetical protein
VAQRKVVGSGVEHLYDVRVLSGVLHQLDDAVDALASADLARHELAFLLRVRDRIDHLAAVHTGRMHLTGDARLDGAASTSAWLRHHATVSAGDAQRLIRVGTALTKLPHLHHAIGAGVVSMAQADALTRAVGERIDAFAADEAGVVDSVIGMSAKDTGTVAAHWAALHDAVHHPDPPAPTPEPAPEPPMFDDDPFAPAPPPEPHTGCECHTPAATKPSEMYLSQLIDRFVLDANLTIIDGETLRLAADLFAPTDGMHLPAQRRAIGLIVACRYALDHRHIERSPRHRPHLVVHTTADVTVGATPDGAVVDRRHLARLACDAVISRIVGDRAGHVLDYGRRTRIIPKPLRDVVVARDRHCRFPGCDRNASHGEAHHVIHWSKGGHTSLHNLVLLCGYHHTVVHTTGWHAKLHPDGQFQVTSPTGLLMSSRPPPRC